MTSNWERAKEIASEQGHYYGSAEFYACAVSNFKQIDEDLPEPIEGEEFLYFNPHIMRPSLMLNLNNNNNFVERSKSKLKIEVL